MLCSSSETHFAGSFTRAAVALLLVGCVLAASGTRARAPGRIRCSAPDELPNGSYDVRRNSLLMRVSCRHGFVLLGPRIIDCERGKWFGEKPVCARKGCPKRPPAPANGQIQVENDYKAVLFCSEKHSLVGNRFAYCNGTHWDRQIGGCRERKSAIERECDFEAEDICGWVFEATENHEWKRVMAANIFTSFQTGPRHDHTAQHSPSGGHYMLMESFGGRAAATPPVALMSPIYGAKASSCFHFHYFMYGASVGTLSVYVRPVSVTVDQMLANKTLYMKFTKSGSQNNLWNAAQFAIEGVAEDFQIVFMATGGRTHLSDIAIDDVKLAEGGDCARVNGKMGVPAASTPFAGAETTELALYDAQSCVGRCAQAEGFGYVRRDGKLFGLCSCHAKCDEADSCCPDFRLVCFDELFNETDATTERILSFTASESEKSELISFFTSIEGTTTAASKPIDRKSNETVNEITESVIKSKLSRSTTTETAFKISTIVAATLKPTTISRPAAEVATARTIFPVSGATEISKQATLRTVSKTNERAAKAIEKTWRVAPSLRQAKAQPQLARMLQVLFLLLVVVVLAATAGCRRGSGFFTTLKKKYARKNSADSGARRQRSGEPNVHSVNFVWKLKLSRQTAAKRGEQSDRTTLLCDENKDDSDLASIEM